MATPPRGTPPGDRRQYLSPARASPSPTQPSPLFRAASYPHSLTGSGHIRPASPATNLTYSQLAYGIAPPNISRRGSAASTTSSINPSERAEQILQNVYTKVAQVIVQARATGLPASAHGKKPNKWFNLETYDIDILKEDLKYWRAHAVSAPQPMLLDVYLDISSGTPDQTLLLRDEMTMRRQRIGAENLVTVDAQSGADLRVNTILLESWQLTLSQAASSQPPELPLVYKKSVAFFRSLYSYIRLLPAYRLYRRFRRKQTNLRIGYRLSTSRMMPLDEAGLDQLHSSGDMRRGIEEFDFGSIDTPFGVFSLHVNYRLECDFSVEDAKSTILSSRGTDLDENYFSPRSQSGIQETGTDPLIPQPRRSSSSSSRKGFFYEGEDVFTNPAVAGSVPRRLTRFGSQTSLQSHDSSGNRHSPVNIPPASLPPRAYRANSITSNTSSPGAAHMYSGIIASPSSRRSSTNPQTGDRRYSWQQSPAIKPVAPTFTPPSTGFSLHKQESDVWRRDPPPFSTTRQASGDQRLFTSALPPMDSAPFASQPPAQTTSQAVMRVDHPGSASSTGNVSRRPSLTFVTGDAHEVMPPDSILLFTPSTSTAGRSPMQGLENPSLGGPDPGTGPEPGRELESGELLNFFRTLEMNRKRLENREMGSSQAENSSLPVVEASQSRLSKTRIALARYHQLNQLNASFSESLSHMAASDDSQGHSSETCNETRVLQHHTHHSHVPHAHGSHRSPRVKELSTVPQSPSDSFQKAEEPSGIPEASGVAYVPPSISSAPSRNVDANQPRTSAERWTQQEHLSFHTSTSRDPVHHRNDTQPGNTQPMGGNPHNLSQQQTNQPGPNPPQSWHNPEQGRQAQIRDQYGNRAHHRRRTSRGDFVPSDEDEELLFEMSGLDILDPRGP
ncbi:autophagy-related protein 13-domain-containing protein [Fimicolochytrium jonesii]|uniref:autophagy-related protein 13-domain-containing protein n=1 Tax=Fimicolochytrium jonesii TaxID=1396493 RepID=UPI0022FEF7ED|nr:autophagy-related protein 13-domain-containing protein [Fimicolochytrium jonesii]KAI8824170.1 autophagy-related protein 13-domain-containing protein [Fimicolochytrium jonesii]